MRLVSAIAALCLWSAAALADADFTRTEDQVWSQYDWKSDPFPVPKGWVVETTTPKVFTPTFGFKAIPRALSGSENWIHEGVLIWRFHYGKPDGVTTRDHLHLSAMNGLTVSGSKRTLLGWQEAGQARIAQLSVSSPDGVVSTDIFVVHDGPKGAYVFAVLGKEAEFEASGAQAYLADVVAGITGDEKAAEGIREFTISESLPPQSKPYARTPETRQIEWLGRSFNVPKDWQVAFEPTGEDVATARSMRISSGPNLSDPTAPKISYVRYPGGTGYLGPLAFMKQLMASAKDSLQDYTVTDKGATEAWACVLETYKNDGQPRKEYFCLLANTLDGVDAVEGFALSATPEDFERFGGARSVLLMTGELPGDRLGDDLTLSLDPVKKLLTTRRVEPFPALVPVGTRRAPVGWQTELSYLNGEFRFIEPGDGPVRATLLARNRFDTGTDAEIALTDLIEAYGIADFELEHSAYMPGANGIIATGIGTRDGAPIKLAALAEADYPTIFVFYASPEKFDAYGGASLLGPVYLGIRPDAFAKVTDPVARIETIAEKFGASLAERRKQEFEMEMWSMRTNTETMIHASRAFMYSMSCGGWC